MNSIRKFFKSLQNNGILKVDNFSKLEELDKIGKTLNLEWYCMNLPYVEGTFTQAVLTENFILIRDNSDDKIVLFDITGKKLQDNCLTEYQTKENDAPSQLMAWEEDDYLLASSESGFFLHFTDPKKMMKDSPFFFTSIGGVRQCKPPLTRVKKGVYYLRRR